MIEYVLVFLGIFGGFFGDCLGIFRGFVGEFLGIWGWAEGGLETTLNKRIV